jgi:hypothetical protein
MEAQTAALALASDAGVLGPAPVTGEVAGAPPDVVELAVALTTDPEAVGRMRARTDDGTDLVGPAQPFGILGS